jgi:hypothetical protein
VPQIVIDPRSRGNGPFGTTTVPELDKRTRKYGYVPDLRRCQAGDLILSYSCRRGFIETRIIRTQSERFNAADSQWTHAAVFLYQDYIVEAVPFKGVITRSLYEDIPNSVLRIRRKPNLTDEQRYQVALCAQRMLGSRYSHLRALRMGVRGIASLLNPTWYPEFNPTVICSRIFYDAVVAITRTSLNGCPAVGAVLPAHLSATTDLVDIDAPWLELTHGG